MSIDLWKLREGFWLCVNTKLWTFTVVIDAEARLRFRVNYLSSSDWRTNVFSHVSENIQQVWKP